MIYSLKYYITLLVLFITVSNGEKCKCSCEDKTDRKLETNKHKSNKKSENNMEGKIVGGNFTTIAHFPHSVAIFIYPLETFYCGGSVLNQKIILTAAHCVPEILSSKHSLYIMAGHENLLEMNTARTVKRPVCNAEYDYETLANDICLMFLAEDLQLGPSIQRVVISPEFPLDVQSADVSGWGNINDTTKEKSLVLKYASQPIIPLEICRTYEEDWSPGLFCAGDPESTVDRPSKGDSGSALIALRYIQIGLVSFRNHDMVGLIFYTNVSYFYDWIAIHSMINECGDYNYSQPITADTSADEDNNRNTSALYAL